MEDQPNPVPTSPPACQFAGGSLPVGRLREHKGRSERQEPTNQGGRTDACRRSRRPWSKTSKTCAELPPAATWSSPWRWKTSRTRFPPARGPGIGCRPRRSVTPRPIEPSHSPRRPRHTAGRPHRTGPGCHDSAAWLVTRDESGASRPTASIRHTGARSGDTPPRIDSINDRVRHPHRTPRRPS